VIDLAALSMTEIVRLQNQLQQELTRRFERSLTLLFSDIVGSTPYFARFGDAAGRQVQQLHLDLLSRCLGEGGRIVDTAGDGAFVVFANTEQSAKAVIELQKQVSAANQGRSREHQLIIRLGMHHGKVLTDGTVVSGDCVNICSRIAASAAPGEIRLSREAFQDLPPGLRLLCASVGSVALKGVTQAMDLFSMEWRDRQSFPTLVVIEETGREVALPQQDVIGFGRLNEYQGSQANDVVISLDDAELSRHISRWHFELRRHLEGIHLCQLSDGLTEVDGKAVAKGEETAIRNGSVVRVGEVITLRFRSKARNGGADQDSDATMIVGSVRPPTGSA
jgi:class 3 adenylate cyclase